MTLSERLRKWKANLTTQTSVEYILTLRADVNGFADEVKALERENTKLREELMKAVYLYGRNDLRAENAKLREQIHWLKKGDVLHVLTDQELADQQKHEREMQASITALDAENAKLRELVRDYYLLLLEVLDEGDCNEEDYARCEEKMRELGIEVAE